MGIASCSPATLTIPGEKGAAAGEPVTKNGSDESPDFGYAVKRNSALLAFRHLPQKEYFHEVLRSRRPQS